MSENLMNSEHKATNDLYRDGYDRIFKKPEPPSSGCNKEGRSLSCESDGQPDDTAL